MTFLCYIQDLPEECHLLISPDLLPTAPKVSNQLDNIGVYPLITLHDDQNNRVIRLVHHHNISAYYRNHDHVVYTSTSTDLYRTDIHTPRDKAFYHTIAQDTSGRPPCQMYMLHLMHGQNETMCMIEVEQGIPLGACDRNGVPLYGALIPILSGQRVQGICIHQVTHTMGVPQDEVEHLDLLPPGENVTYACRGHAAHLHQSGHDLQTIKQLERQGAILGAVFRNLCRPFRPTTAVLLKDLRGWQIHLAHPQHMLGHRSSL